MQVVVVAAARAQDVIILVEAEHAHVLGGGQVRGHSSVARGGLTFPSAEGLGERRATDGRQPEVRLKARAVCDAVIELASREKQAEGGEWDRAYKLAEAGGVKGRLERVPKLIQPLVSRWRRWRSRMKVLKLGIVREPDGKDERAIERMRFLQRHTKLQELVVGPLVEQRK